MLPQVASWRRPKGQFNIQGDAYVRISIGYIKFGVLPGACVVFFWSLLSLLRDFVIFYIFDELETFADIRNGKYETENGSNYYDAKCKSDVSISELKI